MMRTFLSIFLAALFISTGSSATTGIERPANWATKLERPGLRNFFQVTTNLYRGAQPDQIGMSELKALRIKTVVDLRAFHSDRKIVTPDFTCARIGTEPWHLTDADVIQFLKIAADPGRQPVFVHCERGADRTGTMCAIYRIACCGWTKEDAIREMTGGGFGFSPAWRNLIHYVEHADIEKLKQRAGIAVQISDAKANAASPDQRAQTLFRW
jgi:protein tyrosine/serine phosphatase